ncbi:Uncharacterised protein [Achromobacter sp. 2789STDY5608615]|nr:Uncharacterised protein [Achromobacter sp. 2789STDY5608615]
MPDPIWRMPPLPVIRLPKVNRSLRLKASEPLLVMAAAPGRLPDAPPLPSCSVPAAMVVAPAQLLALLVSTTVPAPSLVSAPAPVMACVTVPVTPALALSVPLLAVTLTLRLPARLKLLVNASAPPSSVTPPVLAPSAPSALIATVPPCMRVPPW